MKKLRSILCIVLALTMIIGGTAVSSYAQDAEENEAKEFKALCYNVAGLPDFNKLLGKGGKDVKNNQKLIGEMINKSTLIRPTTRAVSPAATDLTFIQNSRFITRQE